MKLLSPLPAVVLLGALAVAACEQIPTELDQAPSSGETTVEKVTGQTPGSGIALSAGPPADVVLPPSAKPPPEVFSKIAFSSDRDGDFDIYTMGIGGSNPTKLTQNGTLDIDPAWSPDGTQIAFAHESTPGSGETHIAVVNADGSGLTVFDQRIGAFCKVLTPIGVEPAWSPDGKEIAFARLCSGDTDFDIFALTPDGSSERRVFRSGVLDTEPTWSPDGSRIAFTSTRSGIKELWVVDADGSNEIRLFRHLPVLRCADSMKDPAWSPDGTRIAFAFRKQPRDCDGDFDIYVLDADGSNLVQLTTSPAMDSEPAWSPDGTKIAFVSDRDGGDTDIWVMNADGSNLTNLTPGSNASDQSPSWQP